MKIEQCRWTVLHGWEPAPPQILSKSAQLVLVFGSASVLQNTALLDQVRASYPSAYFFGCSTAGEIFDTQVTDDSLVLTAVELEHTRIQGHRIDIDDPLQSFAAGEHLARSLDPRGLVHALVVSDGLRINGSDLVRGLTQHLPQQVTVTGGLSADGDRFDQTLVFCDGFPRSGAIAIVGFYGTRLQVGYGSLGGWDPFGPERLITKSSGNILYELDGRSALELYKRYLGEHAAGLPATGLIFPLCLRAEDGYAGVVRTILSINERDQSVIFAGDVPEGSYARLMKANFDRLIDGAVGAARTSYQAIGSQSPDLAILISCVGRKMVLKQRIEEEVEGVREVLGKTPILAGFYSYGEISPFSPNAKCELHNQTMTITTLSES